MNRPLVSLIIVCSVVTVRGDNEVRSAQEELRRRNIYFGDVDGRQSPELAEALKHYQQRKGLATTGQGDHDTLRSLGIVARGADEPPPKELELPEAPVLKSDTRINVAAEAREISASTGVAPASIAPDAVGSGKTRTARRAAGLDEQAAIPPGVKGTKASAAVGTRGLQTQSNVQAYVENYLRAVGHNRLQDELHFYADRVNYLGNGWLDRRIIENTLRKYYARWPHRSYSGVKQLEFRAIPSRGVVVVTFRVGFKLENGKAKARGETDNEIVINTATVDPRIISIKESRVRR